VSYLEALQRDSLAARGLTLKLRGWNDQMCPCHNNGSGAQCDDTTSLVRCLVPLLGAGCPLVKLDMQDSLLAHEDLLRNMDGGRAMLLL
jgi:hypothetical protein